MITENREGKSSLILKIVLMISLLLNLIIVSVFFGAFWGGNDWKRSQHSIGVGLRHYVMALPRGFGNIDRNSRLGTPIT